MTVPFIGDIITQLGETAREFIVDADKKVEFDFKLAELRDRAMARENELMMGQIDINKIEAGSSNLFVAGWRPFIGWVSGVALAHTWIGAPLILWVSQLNKWQVTLPAIPADQIFPLVMAMLGLGVMRTVEKSNGTTTSMGGKVLPPVVSANRPPLLGRWIK